MADFIQCFGHNFHDTCEFGPLHIVRIFFLVDNKIYYNTHENNNINILIRVYNTLYNQNTIKNCTSKWPNICSCRLWL